MLRRPLTRPHAGHPLPALDQRDRPRPVGDGDAALLGGREQRVRKGRAGAVDPDRRAARELDPAIGLLGLPLRERPKPHAVAAQPAHGVGAAVDQQLGEFLVAALLGHARQVVEILLARIGAEVDARPSPPRRGHRPVARCRRPRIDRPHRADREAAVAATLLARRALQHQDGRAELARRQRRRQAGEPGTDHQHVGLRHSPVLPTSCPHRDRERGASS